MPTTQYGILNQEFFDGLNSVEQGLFIAHRESLIGTLGDQTINTELLTFCENSSMKFIEFLPDYISNIQNKMDELETRLMFSISTIGANSNSETGDETTG